jgi:hypothetical protein
MGMTTAKVARPVKPDSEVRRYMEDARRRMRHDHGYWLPPARKSHEYTYPSCVVTIYGPGFLHNGLVDYKGELGERQAYIGKGIGKIW